MKSKLAAMGASFERLSSREQGLAIFLIAMLISLAVGMSTYVINKDLKRRETRISAKLTQLEVLAGLKSDYQRRLADQKRLAAKIRNNNKTRLLSYIETVSKQANTEIKNASERAGKPTGSDLLKEVAAEVRVENVSIDRLHDFLKRIEEGNDLVKVRELQIETRFDNAKMLNAKVTVGTFKTTEI